ncbi:hypothetical protein ACFL56_00870 [Candidatus Margulisiibacteriota bacterium]
MVKHIPIDDNCFVIWHRYIAHDLWEGKINQKEYFILNILWSHANPHNGAWYGSCSTLREMCGKPSITHIERYLDTLEEKKYISTTKRQGIKKFKVLINNYPLSTGGYKNIAEGDNKEEDSNKNVHKPKENGEVNEGLGKFKLLGNALRNRDSRHIGEILGEVTKNKNKNDNKNNNKNQNKDDLKFLINNIDISKHKDFLSLTSKYGEKAIAWFCSEHYRRCKAKELNGAFNYVRTAFNKDHKKYIREKKIGELPPDVQARF